MDSGFKDKVWKTAYCDGAAQQTILALKQKTVPINFRIDLELKNDFIALCQRLEYDPSDVLRQLVDSFVDRIRLMEGADDGRMTPEQEERFPVELKQDSQIMRNLLIANKEAKKDE